MPPRAPRFGVTIVEVSVGALLLSLVLGLAFHLYARSNTAAAKGVWRVHSANEVRLALRRIEAILAGSSYPNQATDTILHEVTTDDAYHLTLYASEAASNGNEGSLDFFVFRAKTTEQNLLRVFNMPPVTQSTPTPAYEGFTLRMSANQTAAFAPGNRNLLLDVERGTYAISGAGTPSPTITRTPGPSESLVLVRDVDEVRLLVPTTDPTPRGLFGIDLTCRDPVDGRLTQVTTLRVQKNVAVRRL